jgi:hypothetical protein
MAASVHQISAQLNTYGSVLEWRLRHRFPPPSTKHKIMFILKERCRMPLIDFQTAVESMTRRIEAVLTRDGPTPY